MKKIILLLTCSAGLLMSSSAHAWHHGHIGWHGGGGWHHGWSHWHHGGWGWHHPYSYHNYWGTGVGAYNPNYYAFYHYQGPERGVVEVSVK